MIRTMYICMERQTYASSIVSRRFGAETKNYLDGGTGEEKEEEEKEEEEKEEVVGGTGTEAGEEAVKL